MSPCSTQRSKAKQWQKPKEVSAERQRRVREEAQSFIKLQTRRSTARRGCLGSPRKGMTEGALHPAAPPSRPYTPSSSPGLPSPTKDPSRRPRLSPRLQFSLPSSPPSWLRHPQGLFSPDPSEPFMLLPSLVNSSRPAGSVNPFVPRCQRVPKLSIPRSGKPPARSRFNLFFSPPPANYWASPPAL